MLFQDYLNRVLAIDPVNLVRFYPLIDRTGTTAKDYSPYKENGSYVNNFTYEDWKGPYGQLHPTFGDSDDYVNFLTNLETDLDLVNTGKFSCSIWAPGNSADWSNAVVDYLFDVYADAGNEFSIRSSATPWTVDYRFDAGSNVWVYNHSIPLGDQGLSYYHLGMTIDLNLTTNNMKPYFQGNLITTESESKSWDNTNPIAYAGIGAQQPGTQREWGDSLAYFAIWKSVLSDANMKILAARP